MGYIAIRGGEKAIEQAQKLLNYLRAQKESPQALSHEMISSQLWALHSKALS